MNNTETIADILAEMRGNEFDDPHLDRDGMIGARRLARDWADRIEAAAKRERETADLRAIHAAEMAERDARAATGIPGNAAAMRDALEFVCHMDDNGYTTYDVYVAIQKARAALDAPARNCDKYGADGAAVACRKALGIDWSHIILVRKVIGWLVSTEGAAE